MCKRNKSLKIFYVLLASAILVNCGGGATTNTPTKPTPSPSIQEVIVSMSGTRIQITTPEAQNIVATFEEQFDEDQPLFRNQLNINGQNGHIAAGVGKNTDFFAVGAITAGDVFYGYGGSNSAEALPVGVSTFSGPVTIATSDEILTSTLTVTINHQNLSYSGAGANLELVGTFNATGMTGSSNYKGIAGDLFIAHYGAPQNPNIHEVNGVAIGIHGEFLATFVTVPQ